MNSQHIRTVQRTSKGHLEVHEVAARFGGCTPPIGEMAEFVIGLENTASVDTKTIMAHPKGEFFGLGPYDVPNMRRIPKDSSDSIYVTYNQQALIGDGPDYPEFERPYEIACIGRTLLQTQGTNFLFTESVLEQAGLEWPHSVVSLDDRRPPPMVLLPQYNKLALVLGV